MYYFVDDVFKRDQKAHPCKGCGKAVQSELEHCQTCQRSAMEGMRVCHKCWQTRPVTAFPADEGKKKYSACGQCVEEKARLDAHAKRVPIEIKGAMRWATVKIARC